MALVVPLAFGLWSLILGADANWDLYNYHLYNAFSFLNGKISVDLAPGGFQSYFNPVLDVPYFVALTHLPGPAVGFAMGFLHGLAFVLLVAIGRAALPHLKAAEAYRIPILLALAGCLGANFLSELGNTMGDNTTALLILGALAVILCAWDALVAEERRGAVMAFASGALAGLAVGLKLTNAVHAVALLTACALIPVRIGGRFRIAALFAAGIAAGAAVAGGPWHYEMWRTFGNPLFPQFGSVFPNELASSISMADTSWQPKGWLERLAWPFIVSVDARRAGQLPLRQVIWAVVYALFIAWVITALRSRRASATAMDPRARYVVATAGIGFVVWMSVFGLYRYLVALEFFAPLVVFILATHAFPRHGRRIAAWALSITTLVVIAGGMKTWGHADWDEAPFALDIPPIGAPAKATVLLVGGDPPWAWIGVALPVEVALAQVGGNFPEGPAFKPRLASMVASRGGPVFAVVTAHHDSSADRGKRAQRFAGWVGLTRSAGGCSFLRAVARTLRLRFEVVDDREGACALKAAVDSRRDVEAENRLERQKAAGMLAAYGFALDEPSCALHVAKLAAEIRMLHWCSVSPAPVQ